MKRTIFISLLLSVFVFCSGQLFADGNGEKPVTKAGIVSGQVIDLQTGEALVGVAVTVDGTDVKTYTDFDGNFKINGLAPGTYNLIATYISYKNSLVENINIESGDTEEVDIQLQSSK